MKLIVLITNTLRELFVKATLIVLAAISTLILLGTMIAFSSQDSADGVVFTIFGNPVGPPTSQANLLEIVSQIQSGLANGLYAGIVLFGIFATAGIIPETLDKGTVDLYLSKPIARWELLLGKYLGAVAAILLNTVYFIGALWLIFGLKFGLWNTDFLLSLFGLTFVFACLFSMVTLLGVLSRNMAISIIGAFLYLFVIGSALQRRETGLYLVSENPIYRKSIDSLYYLLPQLSAMQENISRGILHQTMTWSPFVQSFLSAGLLFCVGVAILRKKDF